MVMRAIASKNCVSVLTPRPNISVKTVPGSIPVKRKKRAFGNLSGQKSDLLYYAPYCTFEQLCQHVIF